MSFSEMMESGRGPGVIGMFMGLFVLVGFVLLYLFVFDDRLGGGGPSIEYAITTQAAEIVKLKGEVESNRKKLDGPAGLLAIEEKLAEINKKNKFSEAMVDSLKQRVAKSRADLASLTETVEDYKNAYRKFVRNKAKGETIGRLMTRKGTVYENATIKEVTSVGVHIRYMDGIKRIPYEELSGELQDRFQFDPKQRDAEIAKEHAVRKEYESAVAVVDAAERQQAGDVKQKNLAAARINADRAIAAKQVQINRLRDEVMSIERALPMESIKRISREPIMRQEMNGKKREIDELEGQIQSLRPTP